MSETAVLLLAIVVVSLAVMLSVAFSLAHVAPPEGEGVRIIPASVLCPVTGNLARVGIGFEADKGRFSVVQCQHVANGVFDCDRECFPTLVLSPLAEAATT